jgi:hypothetical protein
MYVTIKGTVTFTEEKIGKDKDGNPQPYRVVTLMGGKPGAKPELVDVQFYNGTKVELGKVLSVEAVIRPYVTRNGSTGLNARAIE